jgi:hypothetical protein
MNYIEKKTINFAINLCSSYKEKEKEIEIETQIDNILEVVSDETMNNQISLLYLAIYQIYSNQGNKK